MKKESSLKKTIFPTNTFNWYKYKIYTHVYRRKSCCKMKIGCLMTKKIWMKILNTFCYLTMRKNHTYKNSLYVGTGILLRNRNKSMSTQRKDEKIELSWQ